MKYKVGDKVRVRLDLISGTAYGKDAFVSGMEKMKGKIVTICNVGEVCGIKECGYNWTEGMLEPVHVVATMKFKVGDTVYAEWMSHKGEAVVVEVDPLGKNGMTYRVQFSDADNPLWVYDRDVRAISKNRIVIESDGTTTTATLFDREQKVKTAESKCSPDDTFDFVTGAKLAFDRLISGENKSYKCGNKVRVISDGCFHEYKIGSIVTLKEYFGKQATHAYSNDEPAWLVEEGTTYIVEKDFEHVRKNSSAPFDWKAFERGEVLVETKDTRIDKEEFLKAVKVNLPKLRWSGGESPAENLENICGHHFHVLRGDLYYCSDPKYFCGEEDIKQRVKWSDVRTWRSPKGNPYQLVERVATPGEWVLVRCNNGGDVVPDSVWKVKTVREDGGLVVFDTRDRCNWTISPRNYYVIKGYTGS